MSKDAMVLVDAAGRWRSPATAPGYLVGRAPRNKGIQYPTDPPRPEEIIVVMRKAGHDRHGLRMRALIAILWRGGLRISEALALNGTDIDERRGSLLVGHGKSDRRREAGMDQFGFEQLGAWLAHRLPSSSASSDIPTSTPPWHTSVGSIRARSSTRCIPADRPQISATAGLAL